MADYALSISTNVFSQSGAFLENITERARGWTRSIRSNGGYWQGSFSIVGSLPELMNWFYERLGHHVREQTSGETTWEGLVYEIELLHGGVRRRRSLDTMFNYCNVNYINDSNTVAATSVVQQAQSVARYGRREEILTLDTYPSDAADARAATYLKENAWPWARPVAVGEAGATSLSVRVCGYAMTANWRYVSSTSADGTTGNLSTYANAILTNDCATYLSVAKITTNTVQVLRALPVPMRAWDKLMELVGVGDASGNPHRLYVQNNRQVVYEQISTTPKYYLRDGKVLFPNGAPVNPWRIRPATARDSSYPSRAVEQGAWFSDNRDIYIEEVEVDDQGSVKLKTSLFSEGDILDAMKDLMDSQEAS